MFIVISGPIGAGKSTVTKIYTKITGYAPLFETVDNHPFLERFYQDPTTWAFKTQAFFLYDRFNKHYETIQQGRNVVADRCIYEDAIFAKVLYQRGSMNEDEYQRTYLPHYQLLTKILPPPDLLIYLQASVDTLLYRIAKRSRKMEEGIPRDYLEMLNLAYEEWIEEFPHRKLVVNTDDLDLTCDLHPDWHLLFEAVHQKLLNNDLPDEVIGLSKLKGLLPQVNKSFPKEQLKEKLFYRMAER